MKTITINGNPTDIAAQGTEFQTMMNDVSSNLSKESKVITRILLDGKELSDEEQSSIAHSDVASLGNIEIFSATPAELANETLDTLTDYINRVLTYVTKASQGYKSKNYIIADEQFLKTVEAMDLIVQTLSGIKAALRVGVNNKLNLAEATLLSIMNDLLDAKRQNNYVLLADLLEHDLIENLIEWRDEVFPMLKGRTSN